MGRRTAVSAAAAAVLALSACGGGGNDSGSSAAEGVTAEREAAGPADGGGAGDAAVGRDGDANAGTAGESGGGVLGEAVPVVSEQHIIYTVELTVSTDDVPGSARAAATLAQNAGGFVADETMSGDHSATLTLKVPAPDHHEAVAELERLGEVTDRSRYTEDVTQEVVDTASRVESQRASIARIRALLEQATKLSDVISIESELARREADLDALLSRQEQLAGQTSMATITVSFYASGTEPQKKDDTGFLAGLGAGWDAFVTTGAVALTAVGAILPFAVLAAAIGLPVLALVRRRRTNHAPPAQAGSPPPA